MSNIDHRTTPRVSVLKVILADGNIRFRPISNKTDSREIEEIAYQILNDGEAVIVEHIYEWKEIYVNKTKLKNMKGDLYGTIYND